MAVTRKRIEKNLKLIRQNIAEACSRCGRDPQEISIVSVTKSVDTDVIRNMLDAGITDLGENRVQQLVRKADDIAAYIKRRRNPLRGPIRWHMVGHLQRNKVKDVLRIAGTIHSVDSLRLAEEVSTRAQKLETTADILLQVNCSREPQKHGCAVGAAVHLAEMITSLPCIRLNGLMTMGPMEGGKAAARNSFMRLREILEEIHKDKIGGRDCFHLSMGMSGDYEIAVEEGATILRIGRALFE
jgi:pyridoxal phosphate enzyme (YggS family)